MNQQAQAASQLVLPPAAIAALLASALGCSGTQAYHWSSHSLSGVARARAAGQDASPPRPRLDAPRRRGTLSIQVRDSSAGLGPTSPPLACARALPRSGGSLGGCTGLAAEHCVESESISIMRSMQCHVIDVISCNYCNSHVITSH
jgi:hypothetical protein